MQEKIKKITKMRGMIIFYILFLTFISTNVYAVNSPSCAISFSPATIKQGEPSNFYLKVTGPLDKVVYKSDGALSGWIGGSIDYGSSFPPDSLNYQDRDGFETAYQIKRTSIGIGSATIELYGPGGFSTCSASIEILSKLTKEEQIATSREFIGAKETNQEKFTFLLSFFKNKNFQIASVIILGFLIFSLFILLLQRKIKIIFGSINIFKTRHFLKKKALAIISSVAILSIVVYIGMTQFQSFQSRQIEKERQYIKQEMEELRLETQEAIAEATREAEEAQVKMKRLQEEVAWIENRYLADTISRAPDLASIITQWRPLVAYVECDFRYRNTNQVYHQTSGSGIALNFTLAPNSNTATVITNKHIVTDEMGYGAHSCSIKLSNDKYTYFSSDIYYHTTEGIDGGFIDIKNPREYLKNLFFPDTCTRRPSVGEEIVILGYPMIGSRSDITATEGIISGYEGDYFITSAKIDQGNSGGAAILLKDNCLLGVPTYALLGEIESLGRILRIQAILE